MLTIESVETAVSEYLSRLSATANLSLAQDILPHQQFMGSTALYC
jgi:hypothetical protein